MTVSVPTVGHHVLVELFGCDPSRTDDLDGVRATLLGAVQAIGATAVGEAFHRFSPQGVSGVVLIAESHLSCHTWPETGYVALDIYTCGQVDPHGAVDHLRQAFGAQTWLTQDVVRGLLEFAPETPVQRRSALFDRRRFHAPASPSRLHERREVLRAAGAVDVTGIVDAATFERVRDEVHRLVAAHAERRDLRLATTGDTRRSMSVVRSEEIAASPLIRELYTSRTLLDPLEQIAGERLHPCPSADEEFLITHQHQRGDTHGWHWGDYGYALIWILEAPPLPVGGSLQCVPHTRWNKQDPRVLEHLTEHPIETYHFSAGQTYLLKTDTTLHRTIPLRQDATRIILNMTWATDADLRRGLAGDDRWWEDASVSAAQALSSSDGASSEVSRVG